MLIRFKTEFVKILKAQDAVLLIFDKERNCFLGLSPTYAIGDLGADDSLELNTFSAKVGITAATFKTGEIYYSESPRSDTNFVRGTDNLTPLNVLFNLTIIRMDSAPDRPTGIIQIVNREMVLNREQFLVVVVVTNTENTHSPRQGGQQLVGGVPDVLVDKPTGTQDEFHCVDGSPHP